MPVEDADNQTPVQTTDRQASVTRRLICALALLPIVSTVSILGVEAIREYGGAGFFSVPFDQVSYFQLFFSVLFVSATIFIWRRAVIWTLGRKWLTAIIAMIPFVQVVYAQPLWTGTGCLRELEDAIVSTGQHEIGIAIWIWISIWLWWGLEKMNENKKQQPNRRPTLRVTRRARCLAAAIGTIPMTVGAFFMLVVGLRDFFGWQDPIAESFTGAALIMVLLWIVVWRRNVVWSNRVIRETLLATTVSLVLPLTAQFVWLGPPWNVSGFWDSVLVCSPIIGWGVWMAWTVAIWPLHGEPVVGDASTPRCLKCNYLLRGLTATRCPECGDEPTLDQLWAATMNEPI